MLSTEEFWESKAAKGKKAVSGPGGAPGEHALMLAGEEEDEERGELARRADVVREGWNKPALREWCEKFTRNDALLKEFKMRRELWGWDINGLEIGKSSPCVDCPMRGTLTVSGERGDIVYGIRE